MLGVGDSTFFIKLYDRPGQFISINPCVDADAIVAIENMTDSFACPSG